jgi:hypothetical protein
MPYAKRQNATSRGFENMIEAISNMNSNKPNQQTTKRVNKLMSQMQENEYKLRRAHWEGKGGISCCLNIPKPFWKRMEIDKQSYLKFT